MFAALIACALPAAAAASETGNSTVNATLSKPATIDLVGQTFTVPAEPATDDFLHTLRIAGITRGAGSFKVYVTELDGSGLPTGAPLFESPPISGPLNATPVTVYPNITVTPGEQYGFYIDNAAGTGVSGANTDPYGGGRVIFHLILTDTWFAEAGEDMAFRAQFSDGQGATQTAFSCAGDAEVGEPIPCTVTVTNLGAGLGTPTGTVDLSASGDAGTFTPCTLDGSGECEVTFTPTAGGSAQLIAEYGGDVTHLGSTGSTFANVARRTTQLLGGGCTPAQVELGKAVTCSVSVTDTSGGTASYPTGTVGWASTLSGPLPSCAVSPTATPGRSACSVTFAPRAAGTHQILASYAGDGAHQPSGTATVGQVTVLAARGPNCAPLRQKLKRLKKKLRKAEGTAKRRIAKRVKRTRAQLNKLGC